jgi:nucleoside-diphosphate-sugar epimerase
MRKIFLTGSTGFIGSNLLNALKNDSVYCLKRGENIAVVKEFCPDVIFHVAAELYNNDSMFESNVKLTWDLLNFSKDVPYEKFIYVGSSSEYGRNNGHVKESDCLKPDTLYEATKGAGSLFCQAFSATYNKPIIIARPFSVYGIGQPKYKLMSIIYDCHKNNKEFKLSEGSHDWIYIDDFINGLLMLADKGIGGDIVNFGTGIQSTNYEVLETFENVLKSKMNYKIVDKIRSYDSDNWVCDTSYSKDKYGFCCEYSLKDGVEKYVNYQKIIGN